MSQRVTCPWSLLGSLPVHTSTQRQKCGVTRQSCGRQPWQLLGIIMETIFSQHRQAQRAGTAMMGVIMIPLMNHPILGRGVIISSSNSTLIALNSELYIYPPFKFPHPMLIFIQGLSYLTMLWYPIYVLPYFT